MPSICYYQKNKPIVKCRKNKIADASCIGYSLNLNLRLCHCTRADDLANPYRPDFVTGNLPALIEACRGKDDYSAEIEKLTGLTSREKEALSWLVGNELFSETR